MKARSLSPLRSSSPPLSKLPLPDLFKIVQRVDSSSVPGYVVPRQYIADKSPIKKKKQPNEQSSVDSSRASSQSPKRRFFLDNIIKVSEAIPSSVQYSKLEKWVLSTEEFQALHPKHQHLGQHSYHHDRSTIFNDIERIEAKNAPKKVWRKPDDHNSKQVFRLLAEKKKLREAAFYQSQLHVDRKTQFDEASALAESTPGPGKQSFTHISSKPPIVVDKRDCEYWKAKHASLSPSRQKTFPGVGTYDHYPSSYSTFGKIQNEREREILLGNKRIPDKPKCIRVAADGTVDFLHTGFGTERRTSPFKPSKQSNFPSAGPGSHQITEIWEQPSRHPDSTESDKKSISPARGSQPLKNISKGIERSMYYDKLPRIS